MIEPQLIHRVYRDGANVLIKTTTNATILKEFDSNKDAAAWLEKLIQYCRERHFDVKESGLHEL